MSDHSTDILTIVGVDHATFNSGCADIRLVGRHSKKRIGRVFKKGGKVVFRAGEAIDWFGDEDDSNTITVQA